MAEASPEEVRAASVRTFTTSVSTTKESVPAGDLIVYTFTKTNAAGEVIESRDVGFTPPDTNILVMMVARMESSNDLELTATTVNMFFSMLADDDDARWFNRRLFDPKDKFDSSNIAETLSALVEDLGDRPTDPASASSHSRGGRGKTSKGKRHGHRSSHGAARSASGSPSSAPSSANG